MNRARAWWGRLTHGKKRRTAMTGMIATLVVVGGVGGGAVFSGRGGGSTVITCNQSSTSAADFTSDLSAITNGQTLCLTNAVDYGSFTGTSKAVTIIAQSGTGSPSPVNATMSLNLSDGDTGFTIDGGRADHGSTGLTIDGMDAEGANGCPSACGGIGGPTDVTVRNSAFTDQVFIDGDETRNIVLDGNTHNYPFTSFDGSVNSKIFLGQHMEGTVSDPSVTIKNSQIFNGDLDGVHIGGGSGYIIEDSEFKDICQDGPNHTDNIQTDTSLTTDVIIRRNWVHQDEFCGTQGVTSYDNGSEGYVIEDNVICLRWGPVLELYGDTDSVVQHNTLCYYDADPSTADETHCEFFNQTCGKIIVSHKSELPAGSGTHVYDNIATSISISDGSTGTLDHNMCHLSGCTGTGTITGTPVFAGGSDPNTFTSRCDYALASGSPGEDAASDGLDIGIRC